MLSPAKAAERLGLTRQWVQRLCARGDIAAENIGTAARPRYVIQEQELARFAALTRPQGRPRRIIVNREPVTTGTATDFAGSIYDIEQLPPTANEGDTCTIHWPGGSGWYHTTYVWHDGEWSGEGTTAPWQLHIG